MKSIRLDFPADAGNDKEVLALMQDAFLYCATAKISTSKQQISRALGRAVSVARVDQYDDRYGGGERSEDPA